MPKLIETKAPWIDSNDLNSVEFEYDNEDSLYRALSGLNIKIHAACDYHFESLKCLVEYGPDGSTRILAVVADA